MPEEVKIDIEGHCQLVARAGAGRQPCGPEASTSYPPTPWHLKQG